MDLEKKIRQLQTGDRGEALSKLTASEEGQLLMQRFDGAGIEDAVRRGDTAALREFMTQVLSTQEGRSFSRAVLKTVEGHGK